MKKLSLITLTVLLTAATSEASVTLAFEFLSLRDSAGTALTDGSTVAIFADTDGDLIFPSNNDLVGQTLNAGTSYGGDLLLALGSTVTDSGDAGFFSLGSTSYDAPNSIAAGTRFSIVWFDTTSTTVISGTDYGIFQSTVVDDSEAGAAMVRPGDGGSANIAYYDDNFLGSASIVDFSASETLTAVPEPSSIALLALGSLALLLRRSR